MQSKIFCLLTDFGLEDVYVGQVKCVLASQNINAQIIDISHSVLPHNIVQGSFFLKASWKYIPENSITLVVIDPGVGTNRDILILKKDKKIVLAPDNGVLSLVIKSHLSQNEIFVLDMEKFKDKAGIKSMSNTFHGRDVFAPLAMYIAKGQDISEISHIIDVNYIKKIDIPDFRINKNSNAIILHIDRFGNCVLNIEQNIKEKLHNYKIFLMPEASRVHLVDAYQDIPEGEIGILDGSQGYLELAINKQNLAKKYGYQIGDKICFKLIEV